MPNATASIKSVSDQQTPTKMSANINQQQSPRNTPMTVATSASSTSATTSNGTYISTGPVEVSKSLQDGEKFVKWDEVINATTFIHHNVCRFHSKHSPQHFHFVFTTLFCQHYFILLCWRTRKHFTMFAQMKNKLKKKKRNLFLQESTSGTPVTMRVDAKGFYLYWVDQNNELDMLDIATIRDVRTGPYAKKPRVSSFASNCFRFFYFSFVRL